MDDEDKGRIFRSERISRVALETASCHAKTSSFLLSIRFPGACTVGLLKSQEEGAISCFTESNPVEFSGAALAAVGPTSDEKNDVGPMEPCLEASISVIDGDCGRELVGGRIDASTVLPGFSCWRCSMSSEGNVEAGEGSCPFPSLLLV